MSYYLFLASISAILASCGAIKYIRGILCKNTKPNLSSWIAWSVSWLVLLVVAISRDSYIAAVFVGAGAIRSVAVVAATCYVSRGFGKITFAKIDKACLILTCVCLLALISDSHDLVWSAILAALANFVATIPTVMHAWKKPFADDWRLYFLNVGACLVTIVGILVDEKAYLATLAGPVVSMLGNILITSTIWFRRGFLVCRKYMTIYITID